MAMERNPEAGAAMVEADWEIASHGYRWIDYQYVGEAEREHIRKAVEIHTQWRVVVPWAFIRDASAPILGPGGGRRGLSLRCR
jgi:peptidoglycan/xylan/chitin deacetylase (PgdA/CDA1 family)